MPSEILLEAVLLGHRLAGEANSEIIRKYVERHLQEEAEGEGSEF